MTQRVLLMDLKANLELYRSDLDIPSIPVDETFTGGGQVRLAITQDGFPLLLIPVTGADPIAGMPKTNSLEIKILRYADSHKNSIVFLQLQCLNIALESVFLDMTENICLRIRGGGNPSACVVEAMKEFRELLDDRDRIADKNKATGLFGELQFLNRALDCENDAVRFWTGPSSESGRRDFCFPQVVFEIKTSVSWQQRIVSVSSLEQLMADQGEILYLWYFRLEENPGSGLTLAELISQIDSKLSTAAEFREALTRYGYTEESRESWNRWKWSVLESTPYVVDDNFPKIVPESFINGRPTGITDVKYRVNLDQAENCRKDEPETLGLIVP